MIRINLLGQKPPKPTRAAMPAGVGTTLVLMLASVAIAFFVLFYIWKDYERRVQTQAEEIKRLQEKQAQLDALRREMVQFEQERIARQQRIDVIKALDRNRTGGQELLDSLAGTVTRTDGMWLTGMVRKGNTLTLDGMAGSIRSVANFITSLRRSGYFDRVEIKETRQDERSPIPVFLFSITADFTLPQPPAGARQS
jgi:type IV pilus assembly protein PilN